MANDKVDRITGVETIRMETGYFLSVESIPLVKIGSLFWSESSPGYIKGFDYRDNDKDYVLTNYDPFQMPQIKFLNFASFSQAESLLKVCNGNLNALFDISNGRNLLGLKWRKGYQASFSTHEMYCINNGEGYLTFLSPSGKAVQITYRELDPNGNYSSVYIPTYLVSKYEFSIF